MEPVKKKFT